MKIVIIGGGNMGKSFAQSFLNANLIAYKDLFIVEKNEQQIAILKQEGIQNIETAIHSFIESMDIIILATKPQDASVIFDDIRPFIQEKQIVLSIMAGVSIQTIQESLNTKKVVRCMPNLPCQIGLGVTGFLMDNSIAHEQSSYILQLLNTTGIAIALKEEDQLNAITAISGSGPAYVFYFMQSMVEQAKNYGFSEKDAEKIVAQTFLGAVELFLKNDLSNQEWIQRVASKGGTTEAAISIFNQNNIAKSIQDGLDAALNRSRALSNK